MWPPRKRSVRIHSRSINFYEEPTIEELSLEKNRLISLARAIIKARWFYLGIYVLYGLSLAVITRIYEYPAYRVENRPVMQWIAVAVFIAYNLLYYFFVQAFY